MSPLRHRHHGERDLLGLDVADLVAHHQRAGLGEGDYLLRSLDLLLPEPLMQHGRERDDVHASPELREGIWGQDVGLDEVGFKTALVAKEGKADVPVGNDIDAVELI